MPVANESIYENPVEIETALLIPYANYSLEGFTGRRLEETAADMKKTGSCDSILVRQISDSSYEILNGHYRVAAAKKLGWEMVPATILTGLSDQKALEYVSDTNPVGLLKKYNIDIYSDDYRKSDGYQRIQNARIFVEGDYSMALDEYIERFLLSKYKVPSLYESIYCMGNTWELNEEERTDEAVARDIIRINDPEREKYMETWKESKEPCDVKALKSAKESIDEEVKELVNTFCRQDGGYIQQLKKYLNVDLTSFHYSNIQNMRERSKILFFVYMLKNRYFPDTNVLEMLSKSSMELIDNSFLGWETFNGKYIGFIKHEIEKEISIEKKHDIKASVADVVNTWGNYMSSGCNQVAKLIYAGYDCSQAIETIRKRIEEPFIYKQFVDNNTPQTTPLELFYLKLIQCEYLGQMKDLLKIHEITSEANYCAPAKYTDTMKKFMIKKMSREDIQHYFETENVRRIAEYVYLKSEIDKEDTRRIRKSKDKVLRFLEFFKLADPLDEYDMMGDVTELLIISCLQSILLDRGKEIFDYAFYRMEGMQGKRKGKIYVQAALKKERRPYDALQVYWVRRVMDRYYFNVGDGNIRKATQKYEIICISNLASILKSSSIKEMQMKSEFYSDKLMLLVNH